VPPSRLVLCRLAAVARLAQAPPVPRVVRVETLLYKVSSTEWPVVRVDGRLAARSVMPVLLLGAHAPWVARQYNWPEPLLMLAPVPALPRAAPSLLCRSPVLDAAPALVCVLGAARNGADPPHCSSRH